MAAPTKFIIREFSESVSCFGVETLVSLQCSRRQANFMEITDQRLKRILLSEDDLVILAVKMTLGRSHLERKEYYRDNTQISSRFVASLLDVQVQNGEVRDLARSLFRLELLGGLGKVLGYAVLGVGIPRPGDLASVLEDEETLTFCPFLLDLKGPALLRHRQFPGMAHSFLKWKFLIDQSVELEKEEEFREFRILYPEWMASFARQLRGSQP
ncbi:uncharacterized protein LOC131030597 [Cryptomeria japonica]|uniref:uncharacterized protein LOC131030597 n=1 Tax=Cryptomeria japonica TaxID=3369 RepID=UPI0027D9DFEF|nr:uncharacterized protein LOC131030597 [Cryptomeria japonica]